MINDDTPYKLVEIIRDTWPQLFTLQKPKTPGIIDDHSHEQTDGRTSN
jgi:hypothetical protein